MPSFSMNRRVATFERKWGCANTGLQVKCKLLSEFVRVFALKGSFLPQMYLQATSESCPFFFKKQQTAKLNK